MRGDRSGIDGALGPVLLFWGGFVQRMPFEARLVYTLDHTDSGNPGSLLAKKLCWMYIPFGRCDKSILTIIGGVNIYRKKSSQDQTTSDRLFQLVTFTGSRPWDLTPRVHQRGKSPDAS